MLCTHLGAIYFKCLRIAVISKRTKNKKKIYICFILEERQARRTPGAVIKVEVLAAIWRSEKVERAEQEMVPW